MLSINTNLSSLIAQKSMNTSTSKLNQAIERMTTGFKINHAKDNAANYSITTNMTTKIGAYQVAEDNVAMGMDLVTTASEIISQMENKAERLRALSIQARNGTYGAQSMAAIQMESNALIQELSRLYLSSEYNGISLFSRKEFFVPYEAGESGFIDETSVTNIKPKYNGFIENPYTYTDSQVQAMDTIDMFTSGANGEYKIESAEDLAKLATFVNDNGYDTSNATFVLANDIDLSEWCATNGSWKPIGKDETNLFSGVFDGNGCVIKNLKINISTSKRGLFGHFSGEAKNLGVEDVNIVGNNNVAGLIAYMDTSGTATNCYVTGFIKAGSYVGGIAGYTNSVLNIESCYSLVNIEATGFRVGGLAGDAGSISNSYAAGDVSGNNYVGGIVGSVTSISNSYAIGDVSGNNYVGGLVGSATSISNSYAICDVLGNNQVGGLAGTASSITNSYSICTVIGNDLVGGLIGQLGNGYNNMSVISSYSLSSITANSKVGSFIGGVVNTTNGTSFKNATISSCYALENGLNQIGGCYQSTTGNPEAVYDLTPLLNGVLEVKKQNTTTNLQVGIQGNKSSALNFNINFEYDLSSLERDISSELSLSVIDNFIGLLSKKQTELGAIQNRLDSVMEEISTQYENLVSSRSTIRDADIGEISATYIQQQILQQASATLMATANQSPAIALQLI